MKDFVQGLLGKPGAPEIVEKYSEAGAIIHNADLKILKAQSVQTLAEWWCDLNRSQWPAPDTGLISEKTGLPTNRRFAIMSFIMDQIGLKECLREWNKKELPGPAFDKWWSRHAQSVSSPIVPPTTRA